MVNPDRIAQLKTGIERNGPVVYWMQRDQRVNDNWALLHAIELSVKNQFPLYVIFCLTDSFAGAGLRQYAFMIKGLEQVEIEFAKYNIPFKSLHGNPDIQIPEFIKDVSASTLITDFNPLKLTSIWKKKAAKKIDIPFYEVDAHNIVPCRIASPKQEFGAYTLRPKINKVLDTYLEEFPKITKLKRPLERINNNWLDVLSNIKADKSVKEINDIRPGEDAALNSLQSFIDETFNIYGEKRNDPAAEATSGLSPFLHYGQIAPQRVALAIQHLTDNRESQEGFLEELIIRRELADNYCFYNKDYDSFEGFPLWGKETLHRHLKDKREYIYSRKEFETATTHDELWNAAQSEMVIRGRMHGYLRMYWAKKILEWSKTPDDAISTAIYLNDKYQLDGRDPNGYTGIAWSIGGVHDRAWFERSVFGKVRYMNLNGCKRKFDVDLYINKIKNLNENL